MYLLIFKSRRPEAEALVTWLTHVVLPSIRKTGRYVHYQKALAALGEPPKRGVSVGG